MTKKTRQYITLLIMFLASQAASAQYIGEIGLLGGVSFYNGDANTTKVFYENNPLVGGLLRLNLNDHFLLRFDVDKGAISGSTDNFPEQGYPHKGQADFETDFFNIGAQFELNFFKFGMKSWDKEVMRHTPYVTLGPGLCIFESWNGNQLAGGLGMGVGYKFKVWNRVNIGVEWTMHKLFRDDIDIAQYDNELLDNPYGMPTSNIKNNDWYSCAFLFVTLDIFKRRGVCRSY